MTCWRGIGLYKWNGSRLTENWVQQDYFAMQRQIQTGIPDPILPPHLDPWMWTQSVAPDPDAEAIARAWVERGRFDDAPDVEIDDTRTGATYEPVLDIDTLEINDIFSAGSTVPFHATVRGRYLGGLGAACDGKEGEPGEMGIAGVLRVADGAVARAEIVTCRIQAAGSLTGRLHLGF